MGLFDVLFYQTQQDRKQTSENSSITEFIIVAKVSTCRYMATSIRITVSAALDLRVFFAITKHYCTGQRDLT